MRKLQAEFWEKLRKLKLRKNDGFLVKLKMYDRYKVWGQPTRGVKNWTLEGHLIHPIFSSGKFPNILHYNAMALCFPLNLPLQPTGIMQSLTTNN